MLGNVRLDEHGAAFGVEPGGEPVEQNVERVLLDAGSIGIIGRERVPVGHEKETVVFTLHAYPVIECADVVAEVQLSGGAHTAEHALARVGSSSHQFGWDDRQFGQKADRTRGLPLSSW